MVGVPLAASLAEAAAPLEGAVLSAKAAARLEAASLAVAPLEAASLAVIAPATTHLPHKHHQFSPHRSFQDMNGLVAEDQALAETLVDRTCFAAYSGAAAA